MSAVDVPGTPAWRKSLRSIANGACVEVAPVSGVIAVRDSVNPAGSVIRYSPQTWEAFIAHTKGGAYDVRS